jgi:hypothetical protein
MVTLGVYALAYVSYERPPHHPAPLHGSIVQLCKYFLTYLGTLFSRDYATMQGTAVVGVVGLVGVLITSFARWSKKDANRVMPWLMLCGYGLANAVFSTVFRGGFGLGMAQASRYASLPGFFWLGLLMSIVVLCASAVRFPRRPVLGLVSIFVLVSVGSGYWVHNPAIRAALEREKVKEVAALSIQIGAPDFRVIGELQPMGDKIFAVMRKLRAVDHVPFNEGAAPKPSVGARIVDEEIIDGTAETGVASYIEEVERFTEKVARVGGWLHYPGRRSDLIVFINRKDEVRGWAKLGFARPDVKRVMKVKDAYTGWWGYVVVGEPQDEFRALIRRREGRGWMWFGRPFRVS